MAVYKYICINTKGKEITGVMEGDSASQIRSRLRKKDLVPVEVVTTKEKKAKSLNWSLMQRHIRSNDLAMVTYQFATLLTAGLPIEEALLNIASQMEKPNVKSILLGVHSKVLEGCSLAKSLDAYPNSFPNLYRASIAAGEKSGQLDQVLQRLAIYLEQQQATQQKIQHAMIYPLLLTIVSIAIVIFLLTFAVPKIVSIFSSTGQSLPMITHVLLVISGGVQSYGLYIFILLVLGVGLAKYFLRKSEVQHVVQSFLIAIPVFGKTLREINSARFSRTFGILFAASVPVIEAMQAAKKVVKLLPMRKAIERSIIQVGEGKEINSALQETGYFSQLTVRLIAAGEVSGNLANMLEKNADYQEKIVQNKISMSLALFEPGMILLMGVIVLFIVLAVLLPIFEINQFVN